MDEPRKDDQVKKQVTENYKHKHFFKAFQIKHHLE